MRYLLSFRSLTYAQRGERVLARAGVAASVTRMPRAAGTKGCAYGISVPPRALERAVSLLGEAGLSPERVFAREENGGLREVPADDMA